MKKEKFVQMCPICANKDFVYYKDNKATEVVAQEMFQCNSCGNVFTFPYETTKKEADKIKPVKLTKDILRDTPESAYDPVGRFEVGVYWKIFGTLLVLTGAISAALNPSNIMLNLGFIAAGLFLLFESFVIFRTTHPLSRTVKILLVLALLLVMFSYGNPIIFMWP
ncbi:MAG: hypothetical protein AABW59_00040 [archaeon]